jgi:hypothetical protein
MMMMMMMTMMTMMTMNGRLGAAADQTVLIVVRAVCVFGSVTLTTRAA